MQDATAQVLNMFEEDVQDVSLDSVLQKPRRVKPKGLKRTERENKKLVIEEALVSDTQSAPAFDLPKTSVATFPIYKKKKFWWSVASIIIIGLIFWAGFWLISAGQRVFKDSSPLDFFSVFGSLITSSDKPLTGEEDGEVNILLLGIGGEGHQGGTLADTIILASIRPAPKKDDPADISLFSIPRDFLVELPGNLGFRKINSAYAYGELQEDGLGAQWTIDAVEDWTGTTIPFYGVIDFAGFSQVVDDLGGIDVEIENSFSDSSYPDNKFGYLPTISFEQGVERMDGERALQFARSRHGTNGEGSDFARIKRQQKILTAIKDRATNLRISTSLGTITKLLDTFSENFETNMQPWELKRLYHLTRNTTQENILPLSLDYDTGIVCSEILEESGAAILTVCPGNTKEDVRQLFANRFALARSKKESPTIEFQNSTSVNFLAQRAADALTAEFSETATANYPGEEQFEVTVIYDLSDGKNPLTLAFLKSEFTANVSADYPFLDALSEPRPDFVVVLGQDAAEKFPP